MRVRRRPSVFLPPGLPPTTGAEEWGGGRARVPARRPRFFGSRLLPVHRRWGSSLRAGTVSGEPGWEPRRRSAPSGVRGPPAPVPGVAVRARGAATRVSGPRAPFLVFPPHGSTSRPRGAGREDGVGAGVKGGRPGATAHPANSPLAAASRSGLRGSPDVARGRGHRRAARLVRGRPLGPLAGVVWRDGPDLERTLLGVPRHLSEVDQVPPASSGLSRWLARRLCRLTSRLAGWLTHRLLRSTSRRPVAVPLGAAAQLSKGGYPRFTARAAFTGLGLRCRWDHAEPLLYFFQPHLQFAFSGL